MTRVAWGTRVVRKSGTEGARRILPNCCCALGLVVLCNLWWSSSQLPPVEGRLAFVGGCTRTFSSCSQRRFPMTSEENEGPRTSSSGLPELGSSDTPEMTIGLIADIQYAPIPDGFSFHGAPRFYRHALKAAAVAAQHFERDQVNMVINLGDIIDGKCQELEKHGDDLTKARMPVDPNPGVDALREVTDALSAYRCGPLRHTYGNHELNNMDRSRMEELLDIPMRTEENGGELVGYHSFAMEGIRFVVIDSYDVALLGRQKTEGVTKEEEEPAWTPKGKLADQIMRANHPNYPTEINSPGTKDDKDTRRRFVGFNGAVGTTQLQWLSHTLQEAQDAQERVIVLSHQPIHPDSCNNICLMWNYEEVLALLRQYNSIIMVCFAGHDHQGGSCQDLESGIHFHTIEAALETNEPLCTYGFLDIYNDRLILRGMGDCHSGTYDLNHVTVKVKEGMKVASAS